MATKNIIAELNKGEKLNGDNWDIWHRKVQYILEEQEALESLTTVIVEVLLSTKGMLRHTKAGKR